jgi:hypothetical protein
MTDKNFVSGRAQQFCFLMFAIGVVAFAAGLYLNNERVWASFLQNAFYFLTLALGAVVFVSINRVANAGWDTAIRRVPEAMMSYLPIGSLLMLAVFFGRNRLYEGLHSFFGFGGQPMVFKNAWLSTPFFFGRMALFLGLWTLIAWLIKRESRRQDGDNSLIHTRKLKRYSAIFLGVFGFTITFASFDWLMSIEPLFYSTIYAFYVIAGVLLSGFASITLLVVVVRWRGWLPHFNEHHLHNLGKLVFGFSTFWAYIWLCQYLLIYYANLPEETIYYIRRTQTPAWKTLFFVNILLNWLIPFVLLLPRSVKKSSRWLVTASVIVLIGHWLDLYMMIFPAYEFSALLSLFDVAILLGFASLFAQSFAKGLRKRGPLPINDPYLAESLWQEPPEVIDALTWTAR